MKVTMKDIAAKAGVTQSAVSAVLNGTTASRVSPQKRELILRISKELNYQRNFAAVALKRRETKVIGLICGGLLSPYFSELTTAISEIASEQGYRIMLTLMASNNELNKDDFNQMISNMCDGIIMCRELDSVKAKQTIQTITLTNKVPFVMLGSVMDKLSSVSYDYYIGMKKAFDELFHQGHSNIAFAGHSNDENKLNAYRKCCQEYKLEPVEYYIKQEHKLESAFECGTEIASQQTRQSALICTDYCLSIIYPGLISSGMQVPRDLSVIAFNNTRLSRCFVPPLTSVSLDPSMIARYSVDVLLEQIKSDSKSSASRIKNVMIPPELVIRDSVMPKVD